MNKENIHEYNYEVGEGHIAFCHTILCNFPFLNYF